MQKIYQNLIHKFLGWHHRKFLRKRKDQMHVDIVFGQTLFHLRP